jgi:hypothetical protein
MTKPEEEKAEVTLIMPEDRDVLLVAEESATQKGNMMVIDLIRLHYLLSKGKEEKDVQELADRLTQLMLNGKKFELAGLKDVPKPFLVGKGRFLDKKDDKWIEVSQDEAKAFLVKTILSEFKAAAEEKPEATDADATNSLTSKEIEQCVTTLLKVAPKEDGEENQHSAPRPCDVLFLPSEQHPLEENMPYEHQRYVSCGVY